MCKLIPIETKTGTVNVADIKANSIKRIIEMTPLCKKIDCIYLFGSSLEERCTTKSDIDLAVVSNVTRSRLFRSRDYNKFLERLYSIDTEQEYDVLQFNSLDNIINSSDFVCKDIINKGKLIYKREDMQ